jgi:hypothetical protein
MTRIKLPAKQVGGGKEHESRRGGYSKLAIALPVGLAVILGVESCAPTSERQIVIPIQGAQDFGLSKSELAQYNQTKEDFKNASGNKVFDMTTNSLSSTQAIISGDLTRATGVNISPEQINIDFDNVDPFWINVGADRLSFAPVPVNIQVEGEKTSKTLLFMFGKAEGGQWGQVGFFSPGQAPNESGDINANLALDLTEDANPEIGGLVIASDANEHFSRQILFTKDKDGKLVLVESFPDPNKPSQAMVLNQNDLFSLADTPNQPQANFTNVSFKMAAPAIATVTPTPPGGSEGGTNPEEAPTAVAVKSYETRDTSGKLVSTEDIYGNVIPATHEGAAPVADWAGVNERLGTEFTINPDGTITGIEGLNINMTNGEATFNFDGKGTEIYHIANIKVQEINGVKRLLVAGYAWNADTKSWEVFNPGFPMESPEAQTGWFIEADTANGNWLRFHQRALEVLAKQKGFETVAAYMDELFKGAIKPDMWGLVRMGPFNNFDYDADGKNDVLHFEGLWMRSTEYSDLMANRKELTREQLPGRTGLSFGFLIDSKAVIISDDLQNKDGSRVSVPTIIDEEAVWVKFRQNQAYNWLVEACGGPSAGQKGLSFVVWPVARSLPDETVITYLYGKNADLFKEPGAYERRAAASDGLPNILPSASLEVWEGKIIPAESLTYWSF